MPYKVWHGMKLDVAHLEQPKSRQQLFLGFVDGSQAMKLESPHVTQFQIPNKSASCQKCGKANWGYYCPCCAM
jgi:hypothetical protein